MADPYPFAEMDDANSDYNIGHKLIMDPGVLECGATAFICTNDSMALGVMDSILNMGYRIPEDFSVCGSDNLIYSNLHAVQLTTVDHRMEEKATRAFDLLLSKMSKMAASGIDPSAEQAIIKYRPMLLARNSTGPVPENPVFPYIRK